MKLTLAHFAQGEELAKFSEDDKRYGRHIMKVDENHLPNCVISELSDMPNFHFPMLDDDRGLFHIVQSRTEGHQHIYINHPLSWDDYKYLLGVLSKLNLIDKSWADYCLSQGCATMRIDGYNKDMI